MRGGGGERLSESLDSKKGCGKHCLYLILSPIFFSVKHIYKQENNAKEEGHVDLGLGPCEVSYGLSMLRLCPSVGHVVRASREAQPQLRHEHRRKIFCPWPKGLFPVSLEARPKKRWWHEKEPPYGSNLVAPLFARQACEYLYGFVISAELLWFNASSEPAPTSFTFKRWAWPWTKSREAEWARFRGRGCVRCILDFHTPCWKQASEQVYRLILVRIWITSKNNRNHAPRLELKGHSHP